MGILLMVLNDNSIITRRESSKVGNSTKLPVLFKDDKD